MSGEPFLLDPIEWNEDSSAVNATPYKAISSRLDADLRIHNVLALAVLESDEKINLDDAVKLFTNAMYVPESFPAVRIEVKGTITRSIYTVSLFDGGRIQSAGGCMPSEAGLCMKRVARRLRSGLGIQIRFKNFEIHNLLGVVDIGKRIDLNKMYEVSPGSRDYEPSKFPALRVSLPVPQKVKKPLSDGKIKAPHTSVEKDDAVQDGGKRKREAGTRLASSKKKKVETITASIFSNGKINFVGGKLHQYYARLSKQGSIILNPALLRGAVSFDAAPDLSVLIPNILTDYTLLYTKVKPLVSDRQDDASSEKNVRPSNQGDQALSDIAVDSDELVVNIRKRRKSVSSRQSVGSSHKIIAPNSKEKSNTDDNSIKALEMLSYGILKAGFCNKAGKVNWLSIQETRLFALRLGLWWLKHNADEWPQIIEQLKLPYTVVRSPDATTQLKVPIEAPECADYIRFRRWPVEKGYVFLPLWTLYHLSISRFYDLECQLSLRIAEAAQPLRVSASLDPYLVDVFARLDRYNPEMASFTDQDKGSENYPKLTISSLPQSHKRLPPCMNVSIITERTKKHLKYAGRLQLWPFLKDCGMSIDEQAAMHKQLWGDTKQFDQEMGYTLRHIYGLEGKKQEKNCYSCDYIMNSRPGSLAAGHGCPFYESAKATSALQQLLSNYGINNIEGVIKTNELEGPPVACRALFSQLFPDKPNENIGVNPTSFYKDSF